MIKLFLKSFINSALIIIFNIIELKNVFVIQYEEIKKWKHLSLGKYKSNKIKTFLIILMACESTRYVLLVYRIQSIIVMQRKV